MFATHGNGGNEYPLVVLVNRGTASAAEIVAGAIQDHDRGLIAGEITFGKGLVQTVYPLSENTGLALTTAKYYTPSGRLIQRDYSNISLYDYYFNRDSNEDNSNNKDVSSLIADARYTVAAASLRREDPAHQEQPLPGFAPAALRVLQLRQALHDQSPPHEGFRVDDTTMQDFRKFLDSEKIPYTEADLLEIATGFTPTSRAKSWWMLSDRKSACRRGRERS